ncbi:probable asparagine--tRNA ligase, mitochondrial [Drosophila guanche]|uniref:asparagine--tRNA ligase n=1 Tax=Drosophila guanche TaxID=7266 RepID=A0A3B0J1J0_DROGU|nr:probable asparagine--tRNA ligase, mitochondrial [Drosophila guanche]SPP74807.1 blast:Probable asparagine--tRNA ligase%2C mitochondrial [Drosophila guanche]
MLVFRRLYCSSQRIGHIAKSHKPGDSLSIQGWIKNIRRLKNNTFLDVDDGSTSRSFQVVVPRNAETQSLTAGSVISAVGQIQVAPNGNFELHADRVESLAEGHLQDGYPFTPKQKHAPEYVREHLHLRSRVDYVAAQLRVRHKAQKAIHDYMDELDFVQINTPLLTTNDCEGAGEAFRVQPDSEKLLKQMARPKVPPEESYFDSKVFLSVSGQLHLEAMSYGLGNTYCLAPAFRAENSKSPLHLAEFYMFEAELAHLDELEKLARFIEQMLKSITNRLLETSSEDLHFCQRNANASSDLPWLNVPWKIMSYDEALSVLLANKESLKTPISLDEGFSKDQELFLVSHCGTPVFVVDWPTKQKPFYMKISRTNPERVHALDLLVPAVGELCGGSLRESDAATLSAHPQLPKDLAWYVELRKYGGIHTGGFGMGFERYLQLVTGVKNIRDVIPFPRYPHSCKM